MVGFHKRKKRKGKASFSEMEGGEWREWLGLGFDLELVSLNGGIGRWF